MSLALRRVPAGPHVLPSSATHFCHPLQGGNWSLFFVDQLLKQLSLVNLKPFFATIWNKTNRFVKKENDS